MTEINYTLELDNSSRGPVLRLSMDGDISVGGTIRITKYVPIDIGYELVTSDMEELTYKNDEVNPRLMGNLGGRPIHITMPKEFEKEFEEKVEQLQEF